MDHGPSNSPTQVTVTSVPPSGPPSNTFPPLHFVSPNSAGASSSSFRSIPVCSEQGSFSKRGRDDSDSVSAASSISSNVLIPAFPVATQSATKRQRPVGYTVPRQVAKNTLLATMGSLATAPGGAPGIGNNNSNMQVQFRRQLSGSKLDSFIGQHDSMDVDDTDSRPRSMSF
jgi:hypothetical protein